MSTLTIIAHIFAHKDKIDLVESELKKLIDSTRAEKGCRQYDLHQDNDNPAHFLFFENWESRELWQQHTTTQHFLDYVKATEGAVERVAMHEMAKIA